MGNWKKITILLILFVVWLPAAPGVSAQVLSLSSGSERNPMNQPEFNSESGTEHNLEIWTGNYPEVNFDGTGGDLQTGSFVRSEWNYLQRRYERGYLQRSGVFVGSTSTGLEYNHRLQQTPWYIGVRAGLLNRVVSRIPDADYALIGGVSIGREELLHTFGRNDGLQFRRPFQGVVLYGRLGGGFEVLAPSMIDDGSMNAFPGTSLTAAVGAMVLTSSRWTPFMEVSGDGHWFPAHSDTDWLFGPHISIGLRIFQPPEQPLYRY